MNLFLGHKPNRQHVNALNKCRHDDNKLKELFELVLEQTKQALVEASEPSHIYRLQGRAKVLQDFLSAVEKAGEVLE